VLLSSFIGEIMQLVAAVCMSVHQWTGIRARSQQHVFYNGGDTF